MGDELLRWPSWIGVISENLEGQRRFYRDVLGLREMRSGEGYAWFDMGGGNLFELIATSDEPQYNSPRFQIGFDVGDIRAAREELIARGVEPISEIEGSDEAGSYWCYFRDPEGNIFEITQRTGGRRATG